MEEQLFANVAIIDGLKEWYCRFCLETHVWWTSRSVGGVQQTFRQFCKESPSRLFQPRLVRVGLNRHHQGVRGQSVGTQSPAGYTGRIAWIA